MIELEHTDREKKEFRTEAISECWRPHEKELADLGIATMVGASPTQVRHGGKQGLALRPTDRDSERGRGTKWSKEKVTKRIKELEGELRRPPTCRDDFSLRDAARRYFGSWNEAKKAAGLEVHRYSKWSKERVIERLKELRNELGRTPVVKDDRNLMNAARRYFGSWNEAKKAAGLDVYKKSPVVRDEVLETVKSEKVISKPDLKVETGCSDSTLNNAIRDSEVGRIDLTFRSTRGSIKYTQSKMLRNDAPLKVYYTDKEALADYIEGLLKFDLTPEMDKGKKSALTTYLKEKLPSKTFEILHSKYAITARPRVAKPQRNFQKREAWTWPTMQPAQRVKGKLAKEFIADCKARLSPETVKNHISALGMFERFLDGKPLKEATKKDVRGFLNSLKAEGRARSTISNKISAIRSFFEYADEYHNVNAPQLNVSSKDYRPEPWEGLGMDPLSKEEVRNLINATSSARDCLIIALMYFSGLRRAEVANLKTGRVDTENRTLEVLGKGNKQRRVPYPYKLDRLVQRYLRERKSYTNSESNDYFFVSKAGKKLSESRIYVIIRKAAEKAGIQEVVYEKDGGRKIRKIWKVKPHVLRHSFATHAIEDGVPLRHVMRIMGHVRPSTTMGYAKEADKSIFASYYENFEGV